MNRNTLFILLALIIGAAVVAFLVIGGRDDGAPSVASAPGSDASRPLAREEIAQRLSFDVVRIERGRATVAGRAPARAAVRVMKGDDVIGRATANSENSWVVARTSPLASGNAEIYLEATLSDGKILKSRQKVAIVVPEAGSDEDALAIMTSPGEASRVLQSPGAGASEKGDLLLETIDYGPSGFLTLSGRAVRNMAVRAYLDNRYVGEASVNRNTERWTMKTRESIKPGNYTLRLDQVDDTGVVVARISLDFARAHFDRVIDGNIVILTGDNLWTIARKVYGRGTMYTHIFEANRGRIRDPDLIYPDQKFTIPDL